MNFGISLTTMSIFTNEICNVLVSNFYDKYIQILDGNALQEIMASFENITGTPYI
jgi:hypothetical protein